MKFLKAWAGAILVVSIIAVILSPLVLGGLLMAQGHLVLGGGMLFLWFTALIGWSATADDDGGW